MDQLVELETSQPHVAQGISQQLVELETSQQLVEQEISRKRSRQLAVLHAVLVTSSNKSFE